MPEEGLEASEIKEQVEQAIERLEEQEHPRWMVYLSLATALMAVVAALASLESGAHSNDAIFDKNEAVLRQSQASDQWAFFQAKGIKATIFKAQAQGLASGAADLAGRLDRESDRYANEQAEIEHAARELEQRGAESNRRAAEHMEHHHRFAISVTVFQVAIALCAIAALARRSLLFWIGLAGGVAGAVLFVLGFAL